MLAVFARELKSQIVTMTGWTYAAFVLAFIGIYTMMYNFNYGYGNFEYALSGMTFVYLMAVPVLTMRCFAEERHQKTDQLLYSLPLSSFKIMLGKYLAMLVLLAMPLVVSCLYPLILAQFGEVYLPTAYASIFAFFLLGAALTAIGMFASSLCESQVTAAVACFIMLIIDYFLPSLSTYIPSGTVTAVITLTVFVVVCAIGLTLLTKNGVFGVGVGIIAEIAIIVGAVISPESFEGLIADFLSGLSLFDRFSPFVNGMFDLTSVTFFVAVCVVFAFLTVNSFDKRRWS